MLHVLHKHEKQTDYWICLKGSLKVGWATEEDGCEFKYLSDKNPQVLEIPSGIYHGYKSFLEPGTILRITLLENMTQQMNTANIGDFVKNGKQKINKKYEK